jgi:predicted PurR-regulated permease PerM
MPSACSGPASNPADLFAAKETRRGAALSTAKPHEKPQSPVTRVAETAEERRAIRRHILFTIAVVCALSLAWKLLHVIEIVYVSALFAVVLMPVVQRISTCQIRGWSLPRPAAIGLLLTTVALIITLFLVLGLPPVLRDMRQFSADLPEKIPIVVAKIKHLPMADKFGVDSLTERLQSALGSTTTFLIASFPKWAARIFDIAAAFFLCIYFMLEGEHAYAYLLAFFRPRSRERLAATLQIAEQRMSKWLLGQGALMLILGVCSTVAFYFLHVRYFFLLGVLMGLFNIIPVAGGIITILLAGGVAALDSWQKMAGVFIFYFFYVQIENGYLTPRIMRTSVDLMGLSVLIALLVGSSLAGVTGALVAVPTAALVAVLMDEYMVQKDAEAQALASEYKAPDPEESPIP